MTPDPRLAALLADPEVQEELTKYAGRWSHHCEGECTVCDRAGTDVLAAILAASDRWEKKQDTIKVCRMCFTEPPDHAEGCDYTNLARVK